MYDLTDAQLGIKARAHDLTESKLHERAAKHDETEEYPWDTIQDLVDHGFMGMTVPKEYGGPGFGFLETALVIEEVSSWCVGLGDTTRERLRVSIPQLVKRG